MLRDSNFRDIRFFGVMYVYYGMRDAHGLYG